jgi:hypothetical protein
VHLKVFINIGKELGLYRTALDPQKLFFPDARLQA